MKKGWKHSVVALVRKDGKWYGVIDGFAIFWKGKAFTLVTQDISKRWNLEPNTKMYTIGRWLLENCEKCILFELFEEIRPATNVGKIWTGNISKIKVNGKFVRFDGPRTISNFFQYEARDFNPFIQKRKAIN